MKRTGLKKGSKITAEPIRKQKNIKAISRLLKSKPRDFLLWTLGVNNGLRANDLVPRMATQNPPVVATSKSPT